MDTKKTQTGRSMIEMMGYLMVAMGVIIAMGRIVSNVFDTHKYSTASLQLSELVGGIVRSSAIDVDYTEVVDKVQNGDRGLIPNSFRVVVSNSSAKIYHAFGGTVDVGLFNNDPEKFFIRYNNLSKKQCVELGLKDWRRNQYADLFAVIVGSWTWYWQTYGSGDSLGDSLTIRAQDTCSNGVCRLPTTRARLAGVKSNDTNAQCKDNRNNTVTWVFN